ncbi:cupin [Cellulomonas fengjieae]|uniref:cupin n=1 Tax=Cellulomonas fengjieae TaxID=2819978 RepID=UPI001AB01DB1|nr:cupin [Cellulomonas fengjieae]MBO3101808.1 cupin [Cellulomonas fengjieae]
MIDIPELAAQHLDAARADQYGRSAGIVAHDGELRQTMIALTAGSSLGEHNSPNAATLQVIGGRVRVASADGDIEATTGQLWVLTHERHSVHAVEDSTFLLTTVTGVGRESHG